MNHNILINKCIKLNINPTRFKEYLSNRKQSVKIKNALFTPRNVSQSRERREKGMRWLARVQWSRVWDGHDYVPEEQKKQQKKQKYRERVEQKPTSKVLCVRKSLRSPPNVFHLLQKCCVCGKVYGPRPPYFTYSPSRNPYPCLT